MPPRFLKPFRADGASTRWSCNAFREVRADSMRCLLLRAVAPAVRECFPVVFPPRHRMCAKALEAASAQH